LRGESREEFALLFWSIHMQELQIPASGSCPLAYFGKNGQLLNAETGDSLPEDWCGVALGKSTFLYLGREKNERSFHVLNAKTSLEAQKEAEIVKALDVDIEEVFDDTLKAYFSTFPAYRGEPLEQTLRNHGLTRVVNVTGHSPSHSTQLIMPESHASFQRL
jgi:hypothetical protein